MKCNLRLVEGETYACANPACGRILKVAFRKPKDIVVDCRGTSMGRSVPPDVMDKARLIAACEVIDMSGPPYGPGTEFRKLAASFGYEQKGCACNATEAKMNRLGVEGCRSEIESLIDEVLKNSRGKVLYMSRDLARWMIDEACRLAEINAPQTTENPAA